MILVTGGIGFIGGVSQAIQCHGAALPYLLQPGDRDYILLKTNFDVAVSSLSDERSLKAALKMLI